MKLRLPPSFFKPVVRTALGSFEIDTTRIPEISLGEYDIEINPRKTGYRSPPEWEKQAVALVYAAYLLETQELL